MSIPRIVAIGASAGGVEALLKVGRALPADFPAPVCMVLHMPANTPSVLPRLLNRAQRMRAAYPQEGERPEPGRIYIAPPDHHMVIEGGALRLGRGPRENGSRPAIDPLFRSIANAYGTGAIGVVLSGALSDGTSGLAAIKAAGGTTIVQDPEEALYPSMPRSAIESVAVDHVLSIDALGELLEQLMRKEPAAAATPNSAKPREVAMEIKVARSGASEEGATAATLGEPSGYACPDCHGVMWEIKDGDLIRFRYRVGHAYLPDGLADAQSERLEEALWTALRSLRESAALATRLRDRARERNWTRMARAHDDRAREAQQRAQVIEDVLDRGKLGVVIAEPE